MATGDVDDGFVAELERRLNWRPDVIAAIGDGALHRRGGWLTRMLAAQREWREPNGTGVDTFAIEHLADQLATRVAGAAMAAEIAARTSLAAAAP